MLSRIGMPSILSNNHKEIEDGQKIILPGVGAFDKGMHALKQYDLINLLKDKAQCENTKILGICLGMQMFADSSEEGSSSGLGLIKGQVRRFNSITQNIKIPHMGWNHVIAQRKSMLFSNFEVPPRFYFTHSYWYDCDDASSILANTSYGHEFPSAVSINERIFGVQFHPEKSHRFGFQLLKNFATC